jgi:4-amino-4-deoxy-L-arabinose transferase-like glycosyltransferase
MDPQKHTYRWGALALLSGLALRCLFVWNHPRFAGDALTYGDLAHNMLVHHVFGFTENVIRPTLIRLPGYPLFLAGCFAVFGNANYLAVLWVQVLVDLAGCLLLGLLAAQLWGRRAGMTVLWLAALCPFTANYTAAALTETLSLFCVTLAFFALERWQLGRETGWSVVIGLALACAVLLRPDQGLLAAAVLPALLWVGLSDRTPSLARRLQPTLLAGLVVLLPLAVWTVRNEHTMHVFQPLAPRYANDPGEGVPFGFQRWYRTWAVDFKATIDVYWNYDGNPLDIHDLPARAFDNAQQYAQTSALFARYNVETSATPALDQAFAQIAAERIALHPLRCYLLMPLARDLNMWLRPRTELMKMPVDWWNIRAHPKRSLAEILYALWSAAYLALAVAGLWRWRRLRWAGSRVLAASMVAFVALRFLLLLTLDNSEPRYTLECYPVVLLLAGFALAARHKRISD